MGVSGSFFSATPECGGERVDQHVPYLNKTRPLPYLLRGRILQSNTRATVVFSRILYLTSIDGKRVNTLA